MATPGKVDYHVHYHVDGCAHDEMTLANIAREAVRLGLDEICVLKHYSAWLPNGEGEWAFWKRIHPEEFQAFLDDVRSFETPPGLRVLAGVESELLDDAGGIGIDEAAQQKVDAVILSVHWLPRMQVLPEASADLLAGWFPERTEEDLRRWRGMLGELDHAAILDNFVDCYVQAIRKNPKVRVLGHMSDGVGVLRGYEVDVDGIGESECARRMEPLMDACIEGGVLWELPAGPITMPEILHRADRRGVRFSATADAHCLNAMEWGYLKDHAKAEAVIDSLSLTRGVIQLR